MKFVLGFLQFWNDLIIGDCWQIAVGIAVLLGLGVAALRFQVIPNGLLAILLAAAIMILVPVILVLEARASRAQ